MSAREVMRRAMSLPSFINNINAVSKSFQQSPINNSPAFHLLHDHHRSVLFLQTLCCQASCVESFFHMRQPPKLGNGNTELCYIEKINQPCPVIIAQNIMTTANHLVLANLDNHLSLLTSLQATVSPVRESFSSCKPGSLTTTFFHLSRLRRSPWAFEGDFTWDILRPCLPVFSHLA